jgi:hypothetical protein
MLLHLMFLISKSLPPLSLVEMSTDFEVSKLCCEARISFRVFVAGNVERCVLCAAMHVVHGGLLVARGKEKVWYDSVYSTTRSFPYYSLATPLLPVCVFSGCLILCLIFQGKLFVTQARAKSDICCKPRRYSNSGEFRDYSDLLENRGTN